MTTTQKAAILAVLAMLAAAGVSTYLVSRKPPPTAAIEYAETPQVTDVLVHVAGQVSHPGVYRLPASARVQDAIAAAGGFTAGAEVGAVNLAAALVDGLKIDVPVARAAVAEAPPAAAKAPSRPPVAAPPGPAPAAGPDSAGARPPIPRTGDRRPEPVPTAPVAARGQVSLNRATLEELDAIPGIGPALARRILYYRAEHGGFSGVDELAQVIGPKRLEQVRPYVTP